LNGEIIREVSDLPDFASCFVNQIELEFTRLRVVFQDVFRVLFGHGDGEFDVSAFSPDVTRHLLTRQNGNDVATLRCHLANWRLHSRVSNELLAGRRRAKSVEELSKFSFSQHGVSREIDQDKNV
jgi:hypothetical protein